MSIEWVKATHINFLFVFFAGFSMTLNMYVYDLLGLSVVMVDFCYGFASAAMRYFLQFYIKHFVVFLRFFSIFRSFLPRIVILYLLFSVCLCTI